MPDEQAEGFMHTIAKEFPYPNAAESFTERINSPLIAMALGERVKDLSYHRTGVPEFTQEDLELIQECMRRLKDRVIASPEEGKEFLNVLLRRGIF